MFIWSKKMAKLKGHKKDLKEMIVVPAEPKKLYIPLKWMGHEGKVEAKAGAKVSKGDLVVSYPTKFDTPVFAARSAKVGKEVELDAPNGEKEKFLELVVAADAKENTLKELDWKKAKPAALLTRVKEAGLVGLGGAGFPTYIKLGAKDAHTLVINGVECEPMLASDYHVMKKFATEVVTGVAIAQRTLGSNKAIIGIKKVNKAAIEAIKAAIAELELTDSIKVKNIKDRYPMGWERTLVKATTGTSYDRGPFEKGIVVINSTTSRAIYKAVVEGRKITDKYVTVNGNALSKHAVIEAPVGTLVKDVLTVAKSKIVPGDCSIQLGGPMMGSSLLSTNTPITLTTNGIVVNKLINYDKEEMMCAKCGKCTTNCPAGLQPNLINQAIKHGKMDQLVALEAHKCVTCGLCSTNCPSRLRLVTGMRKGQQIAMAQLKGAAIKKG